MENGSSRGGGSLVSRWVEEGGDCILLYLQNSTAAALFEILTRDGLAVSIGGGGGFVRGDGMGWDGMRREEKRRADQSRAETEQDEMR